MDKTEKALSPADVIGMGLRDFERTFGWRPSDALEKYFFAATARRLDTFDRLMIEAGLAGEVDVGHVTMDD